MADITDPSLVEQCKQARRIAEELIRIRELLRQLQVGFTSGGNAIENSASAIVQDGYQGQAMREMSGADYHTLVAGAVNSILSTLDTTAAKNLLEQFRIRDISIIV